MRIPNPFIPENKRRELQDLLSQGHKIEAIKTYREVTGLGLKESKDVVEAMDTSGPATEGRLPRPHSDPFEEKKKGCLGVVAMLCAAGFLSLLLIEHYFNPSRGLIGQQPKTIVDLQPRAISVRNFGR